MNPRFTPGAAPHPKPIGIGQGLSSSIQPPRLPMWRLPSRCCNAPQTGRMWCLRANWPAPANRAEGQNRGGTGPMDERTDWQPRPGFVLGNFACVGRPKQKTWCAAFRGSPIVGRGILSSPLMPLRQPASYQDPAYVRRCRPRSIGHVSLTPVARRFMHRCGSGANTFGCRTVGGRNVVMDTRSSSPPGHSAQHSFAGFWPPEPGEDAWKTGAWRPELPGRKPGTVDARTGRLGSRARGHAACRPERKQ